MKKLNAIVLIAAMILMFMNVSCSKKNVETQKEEPIIEETAVLTAAEPELQQSDNQAEESDAESLEEQKRIEALDDVFELDKDIVFDTSEPSIIPTDGTYFDDVRHYSYLNACKNYSLEYNPVPVFMLNPKSNVKFRHVYYFDYKNRLQDGTKNVCYDAVDLVDPVHICFFDDRKYQGHIKCYEQPKQKGRALIIPREYMGQIDKYVPVLKNTEILSKERIFKPLDIYDLSKWTKTDDGYEKILPPEKYKKGWDLYYRLNKLKITSDTITITYQNIKDLETMELDNEEILISQYIFDGDTITYTFHGYEKNGSNLLDEKRVYKKGILTEAYKNESSGSWNRNRQYLFSCIEGEGTYEMYEDEKLAEKGRLIRELDEEGFLKKQVILFDDENAHEITFTPTSIQKPDNSDSE
ncbi:MAG: hypothetical protein MJ159_00200 [Treponemataceae bacterium]|nr:hypothetical protein [Treponemataceae bacterium]